jgi:hypothetical protein
MSSVKSASSSSTGAVAPQPQTTSSPKQIDTSSKDDSSSPTPAQVKGAQQHASSIACEAKVQQHALGLAPQPTREQQTKTIAESAKKSGLSEGEIAKLTGRLKGMDENTFKSESKFLRDHISNSPNADRAFRTYTELKDMQDKNPKRLTNDHVRVLTRGVAEPRTDKDTGMEGVLGQDGAMKTAKALMTMSRNDYKKINNLLNKAGRGDDGEIVRQSNSQMEKALILKAAGARADDFGKVKERLKTITGKESTPMSQVSKFAEEIRGMDKSKLARQTTAIDPYAGNKALQQRWSHSCGPATMQGVKAEADPVYAMHLHREFIHSTSHASDIGQEQKKWLEEGGGNAVKRGTKGGVGIDGFSDLLDEKVGKFTGVDYTRHDIGASEEMRGAALDIVAEKLKKGQDVPIRAKWPGDGAHLMFLSDVRGSGSEQKFLITDPLTGTTEWMTREELVKPNAEFPTRRGVLSRTYD